MAITPVQEEFVSRFKAYMANANAYSSLSGYIKGLQPAGLRECLWIYFDVSKDYLGKEERRRSLTAYYDLSLAALQRNDVYFALRFEALTQASGTAWRKAYSELRSAQQKRLSAQIARQKAGLSWVQRDFLAEFNRHMEQPNQRAISQFTAKLRKSDQLFDCLLVYVEVSQKYADDDKNSLIIFFGVSFQALGLGDSYFAAKYESLVTSSGTIWRRRYEALDAWQRDEKLKPAIDEKKKISIETRGKVYGRDAVAQEKVSVPALSQVAAGLEGPRAAPPVTANQRQFVADFKTFMNSRDAKPDEFTNSIFKRSGAQLVECVEAYLQVSLQYGDRDERSLYVFFGTASLAITRSDAYYSFRFASGIKMQGTLLAKRFGALNASQQEILNNDVKKKKKQARVLDDLKLAYFQKEKKEPTLQALRDFEAVNNPEQVALLSNALDRCNRAFNLYKADDFSTAFDSLSALVLAAEDPLLFLVLLRRCRVAKGVGATLRNQLYWYMTGALYLSVLRTRPEAYRNGFSEEEKQFLFGAADLADPYFADFAIRLDYLWLHNAGQAQFTQMAKGYAQLLLFAGKIGARLAPMVEMAVVRGLVEKLREVKPGAIEKIRIPVNSRYDRGKTLRIDQTIGHVFIVWWDASLGAYIEYEGFEGILFRVDSYNWLGRVWDDDAIWGEVFRSTSYLLVILPFVFELLGYLPDLLSGGLTGLAKAIFINIVIEKATENLGLNSNMVQLALLGAGLLVHHTLSEKKGGGPRAETLELERGTAGSLTDDTGAANRRIDPPPPSSGAGAEPAGNQGRMASHDMRGIALEEGNVIGVHDRPPFETLTEAADRHIDSPLRTGSGRATGHPGAETAPPPNAAPATRQDLALAEEHLQDARDRFKSAAESLESSKKRAGDIEDLITEPGGKRNYGKLKENLETAEKSVVDAREAYKKRKYELRAAESKVQRLAKDLAERGELQPALRIEWNLPDKPTTFRYKSVQAKSWRPDAYVGTSDDRAVVEGLLNEDPNGELAKRTLQNGKLFPTKVGDMNYWKAHPELLEMAHVLSKREGGREVYIVMTKARNQTFSANLERTGGVFKEDAIVLQGIAIDKLSAIELGVPQSAIDRAPVLTFAK